MSSSATVLTDEQVLLHKIGVKLFTSPEYRDFRAFDESSDEERTLASRNAAVLDVVFSERVAAGVEVTFENLRNILNELVISGALRPLPGTQTDSNQQAEAAFKAEQAVTRAQKQAERKWVDLELTRVESMSAAELKRLYATDPQFAAAYDRLDSLSPLEKSTLRSEELAARQSASPLGSGWQVVVNPNELLSIASKNRSRGDYLLAVDDKFIGEVNFGRKTITLVKFPNMAYLYQLSDARLTINRLQNEANVSAGLYHRIDGLK